MAVITINALSGYSGALIIFDELFVARKAMVIIMSSNYISPISMEAISNLCMELEKNNSIKPSDF